MIFEASKLLEILELVENEGWGLLGNGGTEKVFWFEAEFLGG